MTLTCSHPLRYYYHRKRNLLFSTAHFLYSRSTTILKPRLNNQITARELRVIGANEENLGVMPLEAALKLAVPEQGIDLIEIAPTAVPPVARLMNYDKYRYQAEKAAKKERLAQKTAGLKQVQISARAATHDLEVKLKKLEEFLAEDYHVEISMRLKGREKYNKPWALQKLDGFLKMIKTEIRVESSPKFGGRGVQMQIMKKK